MAQSYVLGFAFNSDLTQVLLIQKNRPSWQAGKFNGIGGHIEEGEGEFTAMVREFEEEAGITHTGWHEFAAMHFNGGKIHCYRAIMDITQAQSLTDEPIVVFNTSDVLTDDRLLHNLRWLIPHAMFDTSEIPVQHYCSDLPNDWRLNEQFFV